MRHKQRLDKLEQQAAATDDSLRVVWYVGEERGNYGYVETPAGRRPITSLSDVPTLTIGDVRTMPDSTLDEFHQLTNVHGRGRF